MGWEQLVGADQAVNLNHLVQIQVEYSPWGKPDTTRYRLLGYTADGSTFIVADGFVTREDAQTALRLLLANEAKS